MDALDALPLATYLSQYKRLASEVIEGDSLAVAVAGFMQGRAEWQGTATELLAVLTRPEAGHGWPKVPHALTGRLKRVAPALRTIGIAVSYEREATYARTRRIRLTTVSVE